MNNISTFKCVIMSRLHHVIPEDPSNVQPREICFMWSPVAMTSEETDDDTSESEEESAHIFFPNFIEHFIR